MNKDQARAEAITEAAQDTLAQLQEARDRAHQEAEAERAAVTAAEEEYKAAQAAQARVAARLGDARYAVMQASANAAEAGRKEQAAAAAYADARATLGRRQEDQTPTQEDQTEDLAEAKADRAELARRLRAMTGWLQEREEATRKMAYEPRPADGVARQLADARYQEARFIEGALRSMDRYQTPATTQQ